MSTITTATRCPSTPQAGPRRSRTFSERSLLIAVVTGAVATTVLWWHDATGMAGIGDWLTAAGRLTGLYGGYTVAVVLLLMSRAPWIEHGLGSDRLARWHAMGGRYLISLLSAHALLLTWGYALTSQTGFLAQTKVMIFVIPDVLLATIGFALLLLVGLVSARKVRERVSYETWYLLHLLTYAAVGLSFLHVLSAGADFQTGWAKAAWITLYAAVAAALLWYRWLVPVRDALRHQLRVAAVVQEGPDVVSIVVSGTDLDRLGAQPGQFFRWRFLTARGWWQSHPFSLSALPTTGQMRITVKDLGDHSRDLQGLRPGVRVIAEGPYGAFTPARRRGHGVLLLAGGIGITPLRTMLEHLGPETGPVTLVYRANQPEELIFAAELEELARAAHVEVHYALGLPGGDGDVLVGRRLGDLVTGLAARDAFVCGPPRFMEAARDSLLRCELPARHIHSEQFTF
ncbi:ferredoxin reductase family protein [Nocardioides psychrotolerans]|uniref:ferredoxin reductase family protein n=1 Tax=Nocardioides psychrotolerans TaxID=1005945 RepID=UPI003137C895